MSLNRRQTCFYKLFLSRNHEHKCLKRSVGFFYGFFLGLIFYELILVDLSFTEYFSFFAGLSICLMLSFGIAFSSQIRCISLLTIPSFGGKAGRGVLKALVLAYVISGPIQNLTNNGKEVSRVFACTTSLTFNLSKQRYELMFKPFKESIFGLRADVNEIKDTIRTIKDVSGPITGEIENEQEMKKLKEENDYLDEEQGDTKRSLELDNKYRTKGEILEAKRYEKNYLKKIELRCEDQFTRATKRCKEAFKNAYDICYETVSWAAAWLLCWPMKLTFICNIAQALGGSKRCDPSNEIDPGLGEGYAYLKNSRGALTQNFKDVKLQYKIEKMKYLSDFKSAADTAKAVLHDVQKKKNILDSILILFKRILALVFLRIIINAQKYHDEFLKNIEFDNFYVTKYFRKIDARRKIAGKPTLLPLKKIERRKLADVNTKILLKQEKESLTIQAFKWLLEILTATTFILLDRLFYEALDLVRRHARIDYVQIGHHDMKLEVKGTGFLASLLRSVVKSFNIKKRVHILQTNENCLPQPTVLENYYLTKIYGIYLCTLILAIAQPYILRLRRIICAYFYRKREKKRILFLYNETLKRRKGFFRFISKKVKKLAREQRLDEDLNVCSVLRIRYPRFFEYLRVFEVARRKCVVCGEPEPFRRSGLKGDFEKCSTPNCYFVHCVECWNDMGRRCFACRPLDVESDGETDDSGIID